MTAIRLPALKLPDPLHGQTDERKTIIYQIENEILVSKSKHTIHRHRLSLTLAQMPTDGLQQLLTATIAARCQARMEQQGWNYSQAKQ